MRGGALDDDSYLDDVPPFTVTRGSRASSAAGSRRSARRLVRGGRPPGPTEQPRDGLQLLDLVGGCRVARQLELVRWPATCSTSRTG